MIRMRATHMGYRYMGWRADPAVTGGGLLIEGMVHPIYLTEWFLGKIRRVSTMTGKTESDIASEDIALTILESNQGGYGVIDGNLNGPFPIWDDHLELVGSKGMILANGAEQQVIRGPPIWHFKEGIWNAYREKTFGDVSPWNSERDRVELVEVLRLCRRRVHLQRRRGRAAFRHGPRRSSGD